MDQPGGNAWHYTREGERHGPVTFDELVEKAREGSLNPRLDMVWTQGMEEWKPAGGIEGLYEKRKTAEERETLAPASDPYAPPQQGESGEAPDMKGWPGANRRFFLIVILLFPVLWNLLTPLAMPFLSAQLGAQIMTYVTLAVSLVPVLIGIIITLMRLVNLGMSRWWYLANFVPFLNFWLGYRVFACPPGYASHKKLDGAGVALAILYWLLVLILILSIAAFFALFFGLIGDPHLQDQLREIIRQAQMKSNRS
jgi:uncharacterized membrane protein YhaH (DUF805 family)